MLHVTEVWGVILAPTPLEVPGLGRAPRRQSHTAGRAP